MRLMLRPATAPGGLRVGLTVLLPFVAAFLLQETYRTVTAVIAPDLVVDAGLSAAEVGLITSLYFLAFAAMQLPLGMVLDRFGPRRVVTVFLLIAAVGAAVFAGSAGLAGLVAGRVLTGLGMSCCLMAAFKANILWLPPERLVLANGGVLAVGSLGALFATTPVEGLLAILDWRTLFLGLTLVTVIVAGTVYAVVPERHHRPAGSATLSAQLQGIATVLGSAAFWRIAPVAVLTQAVWLAYQGLWVAPWLAAAASLDRIEIARHLFWLAVAVGAGFLLSSLVIDVLSRRGWRPTTVIGIGMAAFLSIQVLLVLGVTAFSILLWAAFGFFGSSAVAFYAILSNAFPSHLAGRVNTSLNLLVFAAAFAIQFGVGQVIALWPAAANGGDPAMAHRAAMAIVLLLQTLAFLWFLRRRRGEA